MKRKAFLYGFPLEIYIELYRLVFLPSRDIEYIDDTIDGKLLCIYYISSRLANHAASIVYS